jgi:hypothetical protein
MTVTPTPTMPATRHHHNTDNADDCNSDYDNDDPNYEDHKDGSAD